MDNNDFNESKKILEKHNIILSFAKGSNVSQIIKHSPEEVEKIIGFCNERGISLNSFSYVWFRTYDELRDIVQFVTEENIPISNSLFLRTPDEVRNIVGLFRDNKIDITYHDDIFKYAFTEIKNIVDFCIEKGIEFKDKKIFEHLSFEAIEQAYTFCVNNNLDFKCYLGSEDENGFLILNNGNKYLISKDGKTLIRCYSETDSIRIPSFVENIDAGAFSENKTIESVIIPASVKFVGKNAFQGCPKLSTVAFEGELLEIEEGTFEYCTSLRTFIWPKGVKKIGNNAFKHTQVGNLNKYKNLINFVFPNSVEEIGDSAFEGCLNIETFDAPSNLKRVGNNAFKECENLIYVMLPAGVTYFDPEFASNSVRYVCYGDWFVPILKSGQRIGYSNYAEVAENIYDACIEGLKKLEEDNVPAFKVLPMYRSITNSGDYESSYIKEMCDIIARCPKKDVYSKVISKFSDVHYVENVRYLVETLGVDKSSLSDLIVTGNNYNLLNCSIRDFFDNYKYLREQKLVSESILKKIYFGDALGNTPEEMLKDYYKKHNELPELFNSLLIEHTEKNKFELRDRLVYVSTMHLLDDNFNYMQLEKAKDKLKYSLLENVINRDKVMFIDSDIYGVLEEKYPEMCGIMYSLKEKLMGIDEQWFNSLLKEIKKGGKDTTFDKFYKSLTVINHWNEYDETERLTLLKNEIVGRLLYSDIALTYRRNDASSSKFINKRRNNMQSMHNLLKYASKGRDELFTETAEISVVKNGKQISERIYPKINFILTMLDIDPYSFDALRIAPSEQNKSDNLQNVFAAFANSLGYLFSKKEIDNFLSYIDESTQKRFLSGFNDYKSFTTTYSGTVTDVLRNGLLTRNGQKTFSEFISNVIGNAKIPKDMEGKYLDYVRELSSAFLKSKNDEELFKFCGALDLYLRSKSEYDIQSADDGRECAAVKMFDRQSGVSSDARILYSLHNLNRLAHDVVEIDLKSILDQRYRLDRAKANNTYKKLTRIITAYNDLFHMGFSYDTILHLAKKDPNEIWVGLAQDLKDEETSKFLTGKIKELSEKKKINMTSNTFDGMIDISLARAKVQLATHNARMFLGDRLSVRKRKSLEIMNYELDDKSKKVDFEKLRVVKKKLSIIRDSFKSNLSDEEKELIEISVKPKSYFFESKKLFAQEIMNRISQGFSDDFSAMLSATKEEKVGFYANNGYVAEIQNDEHGNPVLVCLCEQFNEPFGIHLQDLPKSIETQLGKCNRTKTIAYAKLDRRGLTLRDDDFYTSMSKMSSANNFVGFRDYDELENAMKSNFDNYDVPAKRIREDMARVNSRSELDGMLNRKANNDIDANTNTCGNKRQ